MNLRAALSVLVATSCAPAPPPPVVIAPKPPAATPAVEAPGARWAFTRAGVARAQWLIPGRGTLRVGEAGRRWLVRADGTTEHAPKLAPADLVDVRFDGAQFVFVDARGDVHVAKDPLGALTTRRATAEVIDIAIGAAAIVGVSAAGVHRSTDNGATWKTSALSLRPGETIAGLAADRAGRMIVLAHPQRVLVSRDDGATFAPLATPGIGARAVLRDADGALWLQGVTASAKLGDAWTVGGGPASLAEPVSMKQATTTRVLAGERIVTIHSEERANGYRVTLRSEPLGGTASEPFVIAETSEVPNARFTGTGAMVVGEVVDKNTTRIVRTTDDGRTWDTVATFEGQRPWSHSIVAVPGWIAIGDLCDAAGKNCAGTRVKIGAADFVPLAVPAKSRLTTALYDAPRDRILLVVDGFKLYRASPHDATLTELEARVPNNARIVGGTTLAADGTARMVIEDNDNRSSVLMIAADWKGKSELALPFRPDAIDLAGDRGLAFANHRAWETADGGEHWSDVGAAFEDHVQCASAGCLVGEALRVGWDGAGGALAKPIVEPVKAPIKREITCVANGTWRTWPGELPYPQNHALEGDVRYLAEPPPDLPKPGTNSMTVVRGSDAPKKFTMLGPEPKDDRTVRRWSHTTADGYVLVRYSFEPVTISVGEKKYNPVDVELGWYSARTGKSGKGKLPKIPPFRVGSGGPSALTAIVDGGLLFMPYSSDTPLHFLRDDGKVETMPRPKKIEGRLPPDWAFRDGARVLLASIEGPDATLQVTSDGGKTWQEATWTLGHDTRLVTHKGKPALFLSDHGELGPEEKPVGILPIDGGSVDPPAMTVLASATKAVQSLTACTAPTGLRVKHPDAPEVTIKVTAKDGAWTLTSTDSYALVGESACVAVIAAHDTDSETPSYAVVSPHDPGHSWLLRGAGDDPFQHQARAMTCKME